MEKLPWHEEVHDALYELYDIEKNLETAQRICDPEDAESHQNFREALGAVGRAERFIERLEILSGGAEKPAVPAGLTRRQLREADGEGAIYLLPAMEGVVYMKWGEYPVGESTMPAGYYALVRGGMFAAASPDGSFISSKHIYKVTPEQRETLLSEGKRVAPRGSRKRAGYDPGDEEARACPRCSAPMMAREENGKVTLTCQRGHTYSPKASVTEDEGLAGQTNMSLEEPKAEKAAALTPRQLREAAGGGSEIVEMKPGEKLPAPEERDWNIVEVVRYANDPELELVLGTLDGEWGYWTRRVGTSQYMWGHYFGQMESSEADARKAFAERVIEEKQNDLLAYDVHGNPIRMVRKKV